jgi:thiol-disulfide isomerase/thioredoxin
VDRSPRGSDRSRRAASRGGLAAALAVVVAVSGCGGADVVDFGAVPGPDAPRVAADSGLRVGAPRVAAPARGDVLVDGGWPEAEAFIAAAAAEGRPVIVNLFASWCPPCVREMPLLVAAADRTLDVEFLGVAHLDARVDATRFVAEQDVRFTTLLDLDGDVAATVGGRGLPVTVAFDRRGVMVARVFGELRQEDLDRLLREVR